MLLTVRVSKGSILRFIVIELYLVDNENRQSSTSIKIKSHIKLSHKGQKTGR